MADTAVESLELNEAMVCSPHRLEKCSTCDVDYRQENDEYFGVCVPSGL
jgi:hypothetical protein